MLIILVAVETVMSLARVHSMTSKSTVYSMACSLDGGSMAIMSRVPSGHKGGSGGKLVGLVAVALHLGFWKESSLAFTASTCCLTIPCATIVLMGDC